MVCLDAELAGYPSDSRRGVGDEFRIHVNRNQVELNESDFWSKNGIRSCDGNSVFSRDLILKEISELNVLFYHC